MATNPYFTQNNRAEQSLYEDIVIESLKMYGQDIYYLPRDIVNEDRILGDDVVSRFNSSYKIEMYIDNIDGFDGEGDLFTKFGVEIRDQATFIIARRRWQQTVQRYDNEISAIRPIEGDLLYIPFSRKLFQIMRVEHEQPFYQLNNLPTYRMQCELFEYNDEDFDTGVVGVDEIESIGYTQSLVLQDSASTGFVVGSTISQSLASGVTLSAEIVEFNDVTNTLKLAHVGADDGKFHTFLTGTTITSLDDNGNAIVRTVTSTDETLGQTTAANDYFDTLTDFLDFSETNPFGDPN